MVGDFKGELIKFNVIYVVLSNVSEPAEPAVPREPAGPGSPGPADSGGLLIALLIKNQV